MDSGRGMARVGRWVCASLCSKEERPLLIGSKPSVTLRTSALHGEGSDSNKVSPASRNWAAAWRGVRYERGGLCIAILGYTLGKGQRRVHRKLRFFRYRKSAGVAVLHRGLSIPLRKISRPENAQRSFRNRP